MMRSLWFSLTLLSLIALLAATDMLFASRGIKAMEEMEERMEKSEVIFEEDLRETKRIFEKYRLLFSISVSMEAVDGMENALLLLESASKNNSAAESSAAVVSYKYALYSLRDMAMPSLETVF